ncbi:hypothetical protein [Aurantivibrio plasticivorans]
MLKNSVDVKMVLCNKLLAVGIALLAIVSSHQVSASQTASIGGSGGVRQFFYTCPKYQRIAGMKVGYTELIDDVSFLCKTIFHNGKHRTGQLPGPSSWTEPMRELRLSRYQETVYCPTDTYVTGVSGNTFHVAGATGFSSLSLHCSRADTNGLRIGSDTVITVSAGNNGRGQRTGTKVCADRKIAHRVFGRRGVFTDSVALRCMSGTKPAAFNNVLPKLMLPSANTNDEFRYADVNQAFKFRYPSNTVVERGAVESRLCLSAVESGSRCLKTGRAVLVDDTLMTVNIELPDSLQGKMAQWTVKNCSLDYCGSTSAVKTFFVYPNSPQLISPADNASSNSRTVNFRWQNNSQANSGYRLVVKKAGIRNVVKFDDIAGLASNDSRYTKGKAISYSLQSGGSSQSVTIPVEMGNALEWQVFSCSNYQKIGVKCNPVSQSRKLTITQKRINVSKPSTRAKPPSMTIKK